MENDPKITREEAMKRFMTLKKHKAEVVERMREELRVQYKKMFGVEPTTIETW